LIGAHYAALKEIICALSNGAISSDFVSGNYSKLPHFRHFLSPFISV